MCVRLHAYYSKGPYWGFNTVRVNIATTLAHNSFKQYSCHIDPHCAKTPILPFTYYIHFGQYVHPIGSDLPLWEAGEVIYYYWLGLISDGWVDSILSMGRSSFSIQRKTIFFWDIYWAPHSFWTNNFAFFRCPLYKHKKDSLLPTFFLWVPAGHK